MNAIKLLIAEDHTIVRQGLADMLEKYEDIYVVAEAEDGIQLVKKYFEFGPTVVLSDIEMPGKDGFTAAKEVLAKDKDAKIVFLTMYKTDDYILHAYKIGAYGLISKSVLKGELVNAVRQVAAGNKYFMNTSEEELKKMASQVTSIKEPVIKKDSPELNERQIQILKLIAEGKKSEEIASELNLSKRTIDSERVKIMAKLDFKTPNQLVLYAVQRNLKK